ncbi:MAG: restriction endonuclease subunit S [Desulfobacteria bacterium]
MQVSTVNFQNLNHEFRIDAEYYREEILNCLNVLEKHNKDSLDNLVDFIIGPFGSTVTIDQYVDKSEYKYIRNKDINDFLIKDDEPALIPKAVYDNLPKYHIREKDLLITVVGTLGKVAIATNNDTKSIFSCKSTIIRAKSINSFYLLVYLNSNTGKLFSLRGKRGAIQEGLNLPDLKEIQVFIPSNKFQTLIETTVKKSFAGADKSKKLYSKAQALLLSELGLTDWQPKHQLSFIKNYSDTQQAERIDAEYYQPKYEEIVKAIKNYASGWDTLGNLVIVKKCVEVGSGEYLDEGIPFVRVSNLSPFEITEEKYISEKLYAEIKRHQPKKDEILFSKDATPGIAHYLNVNEFPPKMIPSGGILRLKSKTSKVNNEYLTLVLNSILTQEQINRDVGGSVILHWRPDQVKETVIPILPEEKQTQIQQKVIESFNLRKQSKHLLECAKRAVEVAIEQDEQTAINWLENETNEMQI